MPSLSKANPSCLVLLIEQFEDCSDTRSIGMINYTLAEILFLTFCASTCGCESYEEIADFGEMKIGWLMKYLPYKNGIPSHDTIGRVLSLLNTKQLEKALAGFSSYGIELPNGCVINIDGKRINGSATIKEQQTSTSKGGKQAVTMVNAYCSELNSCLASVSVGSKNGERKSLDSLLDLLDLSYCLITLDAGFCYPDVLEKIVANDADYLIGLKANQPKLLDCAKELLVNCPGTELFVGEQQDNRGRLEQRNCKVLNISNLEGKYRDLFDSFTVKWTKLKCFIMVESHRTHKAKGKTSTERRYYICSKELMPKKANQIIRQHWHVENKLHWVLDAIMGEDKSTKRRGRSAENFSIIRKMAFNKLKGFVDPKVSMRRRFKKCTMDNSYLEKIMELN